MLKRNKKLSLVVAAIMCAAPVAGITSYMEVKAFADNTIVSEEAPIEVTSKTGADGVTIIKTEKYKNSGDKVIWDATGVKPLEEGKYLVNNFYMGIRYDYYNNKYVSIGSWNRSDSSPEGIIFPDEVILIDENNNVNTYKVKAVLINSRDENTKFKYVKYPRGLRTSTQFSKETATQIDFADGYNFLVYDNSDPLRVLDRYGAFGSNVLRRINLSNTTTRLPRDVFSDARNMTSIILPKTIKDISMWALSSWSESLKHNIVVLGDNLDILAGYLTWPDNTIVWTENINNYNKVKDNIRYTNCENVQVKFGRPYIEGYWDYGTYTDGNTDNAEVTIYGVKFKRTGENTVKIIGHNYQLEKYYLNNKGNIAIDNTILVDNNRYEVTSIDKGVFDDVIANLEASTQQVKDMLINSGVPESKIVNSSTIWSGFDANIDGITYERSSDNTVRVKKSYDNRENIKIPEKIFVDNKEYYVTEIREQAFKNCINLKSISLPDTITSIKDAAFFNCSSLTNLKLPENLTEIGNGAFQYCNSLTDIIIPGGYLLYKVHHFNNV